MKILFFFALFANIVFFLWEVNSGVLNPVHEKESTEHELKQILLVSEIEQNKGKKKRTVAAKEVNLKAVAISSKSKSKANIDLKPVSAEIANKPKISAVPKPKLEDKASVKKDKKENNDKPLLAISAPVISKPDTESQKKSIQTSTLKEKLAEDTDKVKTFNSGLLNNRVLTSKKTKQEKTFCYRVGPFENSDKLNGWLQLNKVTLQSLKQFNKEMQSIASYLVYYPAATTYTKSKENALMLEQKGIKDLWLFRNGELKGIVSLGLFIKESRALSLKEKLVKSGLNVEIMQRYKTVSVLYAQISSKDETFKDHVSISEPLVLSECE